MRWDTFLISKIFVPLFYVVQELLVLRFLIVSERPIIHCKSVRIQRDYSFALPLCGLNFLRRSIRQISQSVTYILFFVDKKLVSHFPFFLQYLTSSLIFRRQRCCFHAVVFQFESFVERMRKSFFKSQLLVFCTCWQTSTLRRFSRKCFVCCLDQLELARHYKKKIGVYVFCQSRQYSSKLPASTSSVPALTLLFRLLFLFFIKIR